MFSLSKELVIDFARDLAYALGNDIGESYEEWLNQLVNMTKGPVAKVTNTYYNLYFPLQMIHRQSRYC